MTTGLTATSSKSSSKTLTCHTKSGPMSELVLTSPCLVHAVGESLLAESDWVYGPEEARLV